MGFSSLYVGASGLIAHETGMQVVSNNLANVSTTGYKKTNAQFGDLISQQLATGGAQYDSGANAISQIGKGVAVADVRGIFTSGSIENSNSATDLAISGQGYFGTRNTAKGFSGATQYTRAGDFLFDKDGFLVDPNDFRLQGYTVDPDTGVVSTQITDIQLPYDDVDVDGTIQRLVRSNPNPTENVEMITNLDALSTDNITSTYNPFFAMLEAYDGTDSEEPFGDVSPAYTSAITVYDAEGNAQEMNVYFDPVSRDTVDNENPGYTYWEYLVGMPPENDGSAAYGTSAAGLAAVGILTFNASGELLDQTAFELTATSGVSGKNLSSWTPATFNEDGKTELSFTFGSNGGAVGTSQTIAYDFGITSQDNTWLSGASTAADVGTDTSSLPSMGLTDRMAHPTTSYDSGSATFYQTQDGHALGYLQHIVISDDGTLSGEFTNGQSEPMFQIAMYRFTSDWGLRRAGGNYFMETDASGEATAGVSGVGGRGTMQQYALETSNVDMAEEFANMILTQRGFQANSKVITTSDTLINTTINIKR